MEPSAKTIKNGISSGNSTLLKITQKKGTASG